MGDWGTDRPGSDLSVTNLPSTATPLNCSTLCNGNSGTSPFLSSVHFSPSLYLPLLSSLICFPACKSWSFQTVEVTGNSTMCYLKNAVPARTNSSFFISGLKSIHHLFYFIQICFIIFYYIIIFTIFYFVFVSLLLLTMRVDH